MVDIVDSFEFYSQAAKIVYDIDEVLKLGNFEIKEWTVLKGENDNREGIRQVTGKFATEIVDEKKWTAGIKATHESMHKVLGLDWDYDTDCFRFEMGETMIKKSNKPTSEVSVCDVDQIVTKRVVLSLVNSIYDPLGFITPIVIKAKILLKKPWCCKLDWDETVPHEILKEWLNFKGNMSLWK